MKHKNFLLGFPSAVNKWHEYAVLQNDTGHNNTFIKGEQSEKIKKKTSAKFRH